MAKITGPEKGFHLRIKTLYDIEKQLEAALPEMAKAAADPELEAGFLEHLEETKEHSRRLEKIFKMIDATPEKHASATIRGLMADGKEKMEAEAPDPLRDVMIAGAARDVEHFEMACYMNAIEEAKGLKLTEAVELLEATLAEEEAADQKLAGAFNNNLALAAEENPVELSRAG